MAKPLSFVSNFAGAVTIQLNKEMCCVLYDALSSNNDKDIQKLLSNISKQIDYITSHKSKTSSN